MVRVGDTVVARGSSGVALGAGVDSYRLLSDREILGVVQGTEEPSVLREAVAPGWAMPMEGAGGLAESVIRMAMRDLPVRRLFELLREKVREGVTPEEGWEHAALRGEASKPVIEARSGAALSTAEAAERLEVTEQTIRNRVRSGELIQYPARRGRGWLLPHWQFSGMAPAAIQPWVQPLITAYGHNGWGLVDFLTVPRTDHHGATYLSLLQAGKVGEVLAAARRANPE